MSHSINMSWRVLVAVAATQLIGSVAAEVMDRPVGVKIGQRMTLKPYVSLSGGYDSNVDACKDGSEDIVWTINPGLGLEYKAESWILMVNAFYQYNAYTKDEALTQKSYHGYGEDITYRWTDSMPGERGWTLMISEKYQKINQNEDFNTSDGQGYGRDRQELKFGAVIQRRFTDRIHADLNTGYYWLDYDNTGKYRGLYGWSRWSIGAEAGYALSRWTDFLIAGSYQGYKQENNHNDLYSRRLSGESDGYTLQGGIGSYATERIQYRVLAGWSRFDYADGGGGKTTDGFSYTVTGDWKISDTWNTMLLATSYYQPTEREFGSSQRVDSFSWGLAHSMVRRKLNATLDVALRRETHEYSAGEYSYDLDIMSFRLGLNYILNRYMTFFGNLEYRRSIPAGGSSQRADYYDYDRFRAIIGVRFTY